MAHPHPTGAGTTPWPLVLLFHQNEDFGLNSEVRGEPCRQPSWGPLILCPPSMNPSSDVGAPTTVRVFTASSSHRSNEVACVPPPRPRPSAPAQLGPAGWAAGGRVPLPRAEEQEPEEGGWRHRACFTHVGPSSWAWALPRLQPPTDAPSSAGPRTLGCC